MLNHLGRKGVLCAAALVCWVLLLVGLGVDAEKGWQLTAGEAEELMWCLVGVLGMFTGANAAGKFAATPAEEASDGTTGPE